MKRAIFMMAAAGCATSYEDATSHQTLGGGAFLVTASGNGFTGSSEVEHYKYRRAAELCPHGFDVIDSNSSTSSSLATFDGGKTYNTVNKPSGSLAVRCRSAPQQRPTQQAATGWWCTAFPGSKTGQCERDVEQCKEMRAYMKSKGHDFPPCSQASVAFCFGAYSGAAKRSGMQCSPSFEMCTNAYESSKASPDWTIESECRETR